MTSSLPHTLKWPTEKKVLALITSLFENVLFCGLLFGWASIQYVYQYTCYCLPTYVGGINSTYDHLESKVIQNAAICQNLDTYDDVWEVKSCGNVHDSMEKLNISLVEAQMSQLRFDS